jgi:hypothetical protein
MRGFALYDVWVALWGEDDLTAWRQRASAGQRPYAPTPAHEWEWQILFLLLKLSLLSAIIVPDSSRAWNRL